MILMVKFIFMWNPSVLSLLTKMSCSILVFNKFCLGVKLLVSIFYVLADTRVHVDIFPRTITNV